MTKTTLALCLLVISCAVLAQSSSEQFEISKQTIDSGAGRSTSAQFTVSGTVGQADASSTASSSSFQSSGGFWFASGVVVQPDESIFADGFEG